MLSAIKQKLATFVPASDENSSEERLLTTAYAATALLIEAAQADNDFDASELRQIEHTLTEVLGIDASEVRQTLDAAQNELQQATCLHELTSIINSEWEFKAKIELLEAMWKVVLTDQYIDPNEQHLMRKIKGLLHIPQSEYIGAKIRAKAALGASNQGGQ